MKTNTNYITYNLLKELSIIKIDKEGVTNHNFCNLWKTANI